MNLEYVKIADLQNDPNNANKHNHASIAAIKGSLDEFGQRKNIVVDKKGQIIAGHGTVEAARQLGWEGVWVDRCPFAGKKARAYALADNRTAQLSEWDNDVLAATLSDLERQKFDLPKIGFDDKFRAKLFPKEKSTKGIDEGKTEWLIVIECSGENEQAEIYEELQERGVQCKIM